MAATIEQQVVLDEALVPSTKRLRIRKSNFRLPSDIQSKESTLQVVYEVLRSCPFFKAFLVTADVLKYTCRNFGLPFMFINTPSDSNWTTKITSLTWKLLGTCCISVLGFLANLLMSYPLKRRFWSFEGFSDIVLKFEHLLMSTSTSFFSHGDPLERNIDYAFLIWEDFVYQDMSIPRRNKVNWHYVRDDNIFLTIKVVSRHQNTQQYGARLPIKLANEDIRNTKAYKEYYAYASGEAAPKPKASARRKRGGSNS
nr:hypothetical protein [Tanacetum cinerariifolium]GEY98912.1 hypothetical protein [Tanacetum cinerariifolium]